MNRSVARTVRAHELGICPVPHDVHDFALAIAAVERVLDAHVVNDDTGNLVDEIREALGRSR